MILSEKGASTGITGGKNHRRPSCLATEYQLYFKSNKPGFKKSAFHAYDELSNFLLQGHTN